MVYKNYYNYKNKQNKIEKEINDDFYTEPQNNEHCLCCNSKTQKNFLFCFDCYNEIKKIRKDFDHNRDEDKIISHYFNIRKLLNNIKINRDFKESIKMQYALSEELYNIYENDYLINRVNSDILFSNFVHLKYKKDQTETSYNFNDKDFREKWPRDIQCKDGHYVRSKSEKIIDDWLYDNGYVHAYEKSVFMPTSPEDVVLCDFFLPKGNVYIEFWGLEDDEKYNKRKNYKIKLYNENNLNRIDLTEKETNRIEDIMPRLLAKYIK